MLALNDGNKLRDDDERDDNLAGALVSAVSPVLRRTAGTERDERGAAVV
jgi:hypothetical protein